MQWCSIGPLDILQSGSQSQGLQEVRMHPAANSTSECKKGCSGSPLSLTYLLCNWGTVPKMCLIIHCRHHPKKHVAVHQLLLCIVFFQRCQLCSSTGIRALNVVSVARIAYPLLLLSSMSQECFESRKGKSCQRAHARFTHTVSVYSIHLLPSTNIPALSLAFVPAASCWFAPRPYSTQAQDGASCTCLARRVLARSPLGCHIVGMQDIVFDIPRSCLAYLGDQTRHITRQNCARFCEMTDNP